MWRWLRFPVAVVAAVLVVVLAGTVWLLSGQRYQALLTEHLRQLLGAEVRVSRSHFSFAGGLGIELAGVTLQLPTASVPFLTAERFAMLLDLKALARGRLLFNEINVSHPHVRIVGDPKQGMAPLLSLLAVMEKTVATRSETSGWFAPTLAVRHVVISNGGVEYVQKMQDAPFVLSQLQLVLSHPNDTGVALSGTAALGSKGELGSVTLQALAPTWSAQADQWHVAWRGSLQLHDVVLRSIGRAFGNVWPIATVSANLRYEGQGVGPVQMDGTVSARNVRAGAVYLRTLTGNVTQFQWRGSSDHRQSATWRKHLREVTAEVHLNQLQGGIGEESTQFSLAKGIVTLHDGLLAMYGLSGGYGKKSYLRVKEIALSQVTVGDYPECSATLEADVNLQEDLDEVLVMLARLGLADVKPLIPQPRGNATVAISLYSPRFPTALSFDGEVSLQQVAFHLSKENPEVREVTGKLHVTNRLVETMGTEALSFKLGESTAQVTGQVLDYTGPQRKVDLHLNSDIALAELPGLEKELRRIRGTSPKSEGGVLSQFVTDPHGWVQFQMAVQTAVPSGSIAYDGTVTFQQAELTLPSWNIALHRLEGTVRVDTQTLATDGIQLGLGHAPIQITGTLRDYLTPQRTGEGQVSFTGVDDTTIASLFPQKFIVPQGGTLDGKIEVSLRREGEIHTVGDLAVNNVLLDPLPYVFHPFGITQGHLVWQGQNAILTIAQGSSAGGRFTGNGRINSLWPFNLELAVDFADLDLGAAFNLDKPKVEDPRPKNDTVKVRVNLHANHLQYKTFAAEQVNALCYWHGRQADLQVIEAKTAGGTLKGEGTLWPDTKGLYVTPQVTGVDVSQLLSMLSTSSDRVTGSLNGAGKIYFSDWHEWASLARWRASLSLAIADGVAQQLPVLVRLWSAVSLQGLLSFQLPSLPTEGLAFSSLTGDFALGDGTAVTSNVVLSSSAVRIEAAGEIDLIQHTLDLKSSLMPLHGITSSVAKVPLAGELLARGAEMLTTLLFRVRGPYQDPTVTPLVVDLGQW